MNKFKKLKLYCFSPPVMLATLAIELVLALYTFWRYKLKRCDEDCYGAARLPGAVSVG